MTDPCHVTQDCIDSLGHRARGYEDAPAKVEAELRRLRNKGA